MQPNRNNLFNSRIMQQIDWDALTIEQRWEEEWHNDTVSEGALYIELGLQKEDECEEAERRRDGNDRGERSNPNGCDEERAEHEQMNCEDFK